MSSPGSFPLAHSQFQSRLSRKLVPSCEWYITSETIASGDNTPGDLTYLCPVTVANLGGVEPCPEYVANAAIVGSSQGSAGLVGRGVLDDPCPSTNDV